MFWRIIDTETFRTRISDLFLNYLEQESGVFLDETPVNEFVIELSEARHFHTNDEISNPYILLRSS